MEEGMWPVRKFAKKMWESGKWESKNLGMKEAPIVYGAGIVAMSPVIVGEYVCEKVYNALRFD